jgi:hypothetical protein
MAALIFSRTRGALHEQAMAWLAVPLDGRLTSLPGRFPRSTAVVDCHITVAARVYCSRRTHSRRSPQERRAGGAAVHPKALLAAITEHGLDSLTTSVTRHVPTNRSHSGLDRAVRQR